MCWRHVEVAILFYFLRCLLMNRLRTAYFLTDIHMYVVERDIQGLPRERVSTPLSACGWFCRQQRVSSGEARNRLSTLLATLALCVFCMPLISSKVRSPLYIMSYSIAPCWCHFYMSYSTAATRVCAHNKVATATRSVKREPDSSQPDTDRTTQM